MEKRLIKERLLLPIYPPLFFKLIIETIEWRRASYGSWILWTNIYLLIFATDFVSIISGTIYFIAAVAHISWAGSALLALVTIARNYAFSLFFAWIIKRSSF